MRYHSVWGETAALCVATWGAARSEKSRKWGSSASLGEDSGTERRWGLGIDTQSCCHSTSRRLQGGLKQDLLPAQTGVTSSREALGSAASSGLSRICSLRVTCRPPGHLAQEGLSPPRLWAVPSLCCCVSAPSALPQGHKPCSWVAGLGRGVPIPVSAAQPASVCALQGKASAFRF